MNNKPVPLNDKKDHAAVRILVFSASLRKASLNRQLAKLAATFIREAGGVVDWAEMSDFLAPGFNQDEKDAHGFPPAIDTFVNRLAGNDAFVIASPENNSSIPGILKNTIDWTSLFKPQPFNGMHGLLLSASPSMVGGNRGLWALRIPLEYLGARIFPDMFSLALAHKAFTPDGQIADEQLSKRLVMTIRAFIELVEAVKQYPCTKNEWVENPGEKPYQ
ncbi:MAG: NAD(P)H-dependent oxidoreductase [Anaerolineaceae bacterium]|nr:NAD(P)H-dependent oxidoreductase [Anaerolineaceae bacterium]MBN2677840.1 NAD(P)H-dependent oxidoreductase [Anaerolineaceae bacterium]